MMQHNTNLYFNLLPFFQAKPRKIYVHSNSIHDCLKNEFSFFHLCLFQSLQQSQIEHVSIKKLAWVSNQEVTVNKWCIPTTSYTTYRFGFKSMLIKPVINIYTTICICSRIFIFKKLSLLMDMYRWLENLRLNQLHLTE